jgi:hypothetical protein
MDLDKKLKENFKTQDKSFKEFMSITETDWHFDGDGKTIEQAGDTGAFIPRTVMGRIVEFLKEIEPPGMAPEAIIKEYRVQMRVDIKTLAKGDRKETRGSTPFFCDGSVDKPTDFYSQEVRMRYPKAWEEFKLHRGYIYHSGQWIKSMYVQHLEDQEKLNVSKKPSGSH